MDDRRSADALIDAAVDRELEAALAVDPPPEFAARVRSRVKSSGRNAAGPAWPLWVATAAAIVAAAVVAGLSGPNLSPVTQDLPAAPALNPALQRAAAPGETAPGEEDAAPDLEPAPERPAPRKRIPVSNRRSSAPGAPELLISAGEARALQQLFAGVRQGLVDLSSLPPAAAATAALRAPSEIAFPPITFEPIAPHADEEGDRQ